jgi:hypothetical protein
MDLVGHERTLTHYNFFAGLYDMFRAMSKNFALEA